MSELCVIRSYESMSLVQLLEVHGLTSRLMQRGKYERNGMLKFSSGTARLGNTGARFTT